MPERPSSHLGMSMNGAAKPTDELGLTGLKAVGGYVSEEFLPHLKGEKAAKVYAEMRENDPVIGAIGHNVDMMLRGVEWNVEPADESEQASKHADFVRECMDDMEHGWPEFISEVLSMLDFGWSWFEVVYKRRQGYQKPTPWQPQQTGYAEPNNDTPSSKHDDGLIGWRKFAIRSQESFLRWEMDARGGLHGMWQMPSPTYQTVYIPLEKSLHFRTRSRKNNPEGRSVLRSAYRPWFFKKRIEEIEGVGIERDLAGLPVAWIPAQFLSVDASEEEQHIATLFEDAVKNTRRDAQEGLVLPQQYDPDTGNPLYMFQLLSTGGSRSFNTDAIIQRYDQRIAMTVLADIILMGHEQVGSYALSTTKEGMLRASLTAWLDHIADVLNTVELPRLWRINGLPDETMPKFTHGEIDTPAPAELASFVATLAAAGMPFFPSQDLENHLLTAAKLPTRDEDEWEALHAAQQQMQQQMQQAFDSETEEEEEFNPFDEEVEEEEEFVAGPEAPAETPNLDAIKARRPRA